jgi:heptosyltransferase-3
MTFEAILAIKLRDLGDTALWTSSLRALRNRFPTVRLDALTLERSEPLLKETPFIDRVHTIKDAHAGPLVRKLWELRSQKYDAALAFHATTSLARYLPMLGAPTRIIHHHSQTKNLFWSTTPVPRPGNLENAIRRDFQLLEALGISEPIPEPQLIVSPTELADAQTLLMKAGLNPQHSLITLLPGARAATRRYPLDLWKTTLKELVKRWPARAYIVADAELSHSWSLQSLGSDLGIPVFDSVSLRQMMALIAAGEMAVGNDSGPIHIAAALGRYTLTLFGPGCYGDWHPYDLARHPALRIEVDCRADGPRDRPEFQYCRLTECSHLSCLRGIPPTRILSEIQAILHKL